MSKTLHRKRHRPQDRKTAGQNNRAIKKYLPVVAVIVLAGIPFYMGKYVEFNTPDPYDGSSYAYSAEHIVQGAKIGVEELPSAQIGTLLVNMLGVSLFGYSEIGAEIVQTLLQLAALVLMFVSLRRVFGMLPAAISVIVAATFLSSPLIAKYGNVKEQYMIACMVIAVSCFMLYQVTGKWWIALIAGGFAVWAPLFKPTGCSALGALGLFVIAQPIFKHRTFRQTGLDILLLFAGAAVALAPLYIWILGWNIQLDVPYAFVWNTIGKALAPASQSEGNASGYIASSRALVPFSELWPRVMRYYWMLRLPITLGIGSILLRLTVIVRRLYKKSQVPDAEDLGGRFVLLLAAWWILDMAFVWISPRSYEQYYLPLTASGAMLGGYIVALFWHKATTALLKTKWVLTAAAALAVMAAFSWHVFFGIATSPYSGKKYEAEINGFSQRVQEVSLYKQKKARGAWEVVSEYIRDHSTPDDRIYVWGWYPGIYVMSQRLSVVPKACSMPRQPPEKVQELVAGLLAAFEQNPPKFIVDSRKLHIPTYWPPLELWPIVREGFIKGLKPGFLPNDPAIVEFYDKAWAAGLSENCSPDEARRYEALKPLRAYIMGHYRVVRMVGPHVLFEYKGNPDTQSSQ
jgi:4-amino-4-deoxy-L-arabinose transferase-like glycosyltransferase